MASSSSSPISIFFLLFTFLPLALSQSTIQIPTARKTWSKDDGIYCDSWRLSVETNNAGYWVNAPARCESYVEDYMTTERYLSDSEIVAADSISFAKSVNVTGDGKDAWVFDIDETLLSNLPYYDVHGFGYQPFDEKSFDEWVDLAEAPALPASFNLYKELKRLGFTIILLTGRNEHQRNSTGKNLLFAGYTDWERLFLRGVTDQGKTATVYKSEKRMELVNEGYRIHGNSGDQWSDLLGFAVAKRSFKLPNPLYYIA
ncbi:acid phosphatase 1-like [Mercurialis annua]|uniref:acid phosphatase 1-like n=1 Tax=Mercurialis annua TaxID=3986 RepID=UPI00215E5F7F|nr:acid phosphatase 1-like [Mercurialis annua]